MRQSVNISTNVMMNLFEIMVSLLIGSMMLFAVVACVVLLPLLLLCTLLMYVSPKFYRLIVGKTGGPHANL